MNRSNRPWNFKKILVVGFILYGVGLVVVLAAAFFWFSSIREKGRRMDEQPARKVVRRVVPPPRPRQEPVHTANMPVEQDLESGPAKATNSLPLFQSEPTLGGQISTNIVERTIPRLSGRESRSHPGDDLFENDFIPRLQIEIPAAGRLALRMSGRTYIRATIREGDIVYTNVAIRLKGGPGSYQELDRLPSFTVNFDKFANGQTFHGLKKIHLNASPQDRSFLSEKISRELFEASGVPTPRAGNAVVIFNGQTRMYGVVEGINKQFLRRYFKDVTGDVYDGHSGSDVTSNLPTNAGDHPEEKWRRLRALAAAVRLPVTLRLAGLEKTLDIDRFLSFMAMETILWHWDGYTIHRNNFRIYHDRDTDRMIFLPHGLDQVLSKPAGPIVPPADGLVARAVLDIPELRRRYEERVAQLVTNVFLVESITRRIDEVAKKITETIAEIDPAALGPYRSRVNNLSNRFRQRAASLQRQIFPAAESDLASLETLSQANWRPTTDLGEAQLTRKLDDTGNPILHIATSTGCTASWRTHVLLDRGRYRFETRLKTKGVVLDPNDPRAGAGLRVSRHRVGQKNSGDRDWMPVAFDLEVREEQSDVELVCELRADQGEVWFDVKSFRISRR